MRVPYGNAHPRITIIQIKITDKYRIVYIFHLFTVDVKTSAKSSHERSGIYLKELVATTVKKMSVMFFQYGYKLLV